MSGRIVISDVSKRFAVRRWDEPRRLKDAALALLTRAEPPVPVVALEQVSLHVQPGEAVGFVGRNGAGKSTLLRIVAGVLRADDGDVVVDGRVAAMLEIGAGFHPELTGAESAVTAAVVAGLTRRQAVARLPDVTAFAELSDTEMRRPVRTYSTGMRARLAFAVAVGVEPDVLVVDEILSVGDLRFQRRSRDAIAGFRRRGTTLLLASHDVSSLPTLVDRVVWIDHGRVRDDGPAPAVVDRYRRELFDDLDPVSLDTSLSRSGDGEARTDDVTVRVHERSLRVAFSVTGRRPVHAQVKVHDANGTAILDTSTVVEHTSAASHVGLEASLRDAAPGDYVVSIGLHAMDWRTCHDYVERGWRFHLEGELRTGVLDPPVDWQVTG